MKSKPTEWGIMKSPFSKIETSKLLKFRSHFLRDIFPDPANEDLTSIYVLRPKTAFTYM
jgi:hypothetical protein